MHASPEEENPSRCLFSLLCTCDKRILNEITLGRGYVGETREKAADKGEERNKVETLK